MVFGPLFSLSSSTSANAFNSSADTFSTGRISRLVSASWSSSFPRVSAPCLPRSHARSAPSTSCCFGRESAISYYQGSDFNKFFGHCRLTYFVPIDNSFFADKHPQLRLPINNMTKQRRGAAPPGAGPPSNFSLALSCFVPWVLSATFP